MFDPAGVLSRHLRRDTQLGEPPGEQPVALINPGGDGHARLCQGQKAILVHLHIAVFTQQAHRPAHTGFGISHMMHHIDGAHQAFFLLQDQDRLQIVLGGFLNLHGLPSIPSKNIRLMGDCLFCYFSTKNGDTQGARFLPNGD